MHQQEAYKTLYKRMNPQLLKPEIQELVNDINIKKTAAGKTLWIRQALFLKDAWYLVMEMEPGEEFLEVEWVFIIKNIIDFNRNSYYFGGLEKFHRNIKILKFFPPITNESGVLKLHFFNLHKGDIRIIMIERLLRVMIQLGKEPEPTIENTRKLLQDTMDEFDLKYYIPEDPKTMFDFIKEINKEIKPCKGILEESFWERFKRGVTEHWTFKFNLKDMKKEKYSVRTLKTNKKITYKNEDFIINRIIIYPDSFLITMITPPQANTFEFYYRQDNGELAGSLKSRNCHNIVDDLNLMFGGIFKSRESCFFQCKLSENVTEDKLVERIVVKDLKDDPNALFMYS